MRLVLIAFVTLVSATEARSDSEKGTEAIAFQVTTPVSLDSDKYLFDTATFEAKIVNRSRTAATVITYAPAVVCPVSVTKNGVRVPRRKRDSRADLLSRDAIIQRSRTEVPPGEASSITIPGLWCSIPGSNTEVYWRCSGAGVYKVTFRYELSEQVRGVVESSSAPRDGSAIAPKSIVSNEVTINVE